MSNPALSSVITQVQRPPTSSPKNAKSQGSNNGNQQPNVEEEEEDLEEVVISVPNQQQRIATKRLAKGDSSSNGSNASTESPTAPVVAASGAAGGSTSDTEEPKKSGGWSLFSCFCCSTSNETAGGASNSSGDDDEVVTSSTASPGAGSTGGAAAGGNTRGANGAPARAAATYGNHLKISTYQIPVPPPYHGPPLLPPLLPANKGKKCLVLDLDETLVHSSFKPVPNADFIIPVEIENEIHQVYVLKRPGVDEFMLECAKKYEIVIFTASLAKYADPLLDQLDIHKTIFARLFREACVNHCGNFVKDLSRLGRDMRSVIIVDNSPHSYAFHPFNAVAIDTWFDAMDDTQLYDLHRFLDALADHPDVSQVLDATKGRQF